VAARLTPPSSFRTDASSIQISLALHDDIEVHWVASFYCTPTAFGIWAGSCDIEGSDRLLEVVALSIPEESSEEFLIDNARAPIVLELDRSSLFHVEPASPGEWATGRHGALERGNRERAREAFFAQPLLAPDATLANDEYAAIIVADRVLLTVQHRVPGLILTRLENSTVGGDVGDVISDLMGQFGYPPEFNRRVWLQMMRDQNPSAVIHAPRIHASSPAEAIQYVSMLTERLLDLTAIRRISRARVLGGLLIGPDAGGPRTYTPWRGTPTYGGNLAGGFAAGEDARHLLNLWRDLEADERAQLWLSVYADSFNEARPDHQFLRRFSLLEGIAGSVFRVAQPVFDSSGAPYTLPDGTPYTTDHARGAVYSLILRIAGGTVHLGAYSSQRPAPSGATPEADLWEDVGVWVKIRNVVAHEGTARRIRGVSPDRERRRFERTLARYGHIAGDWRVGFEAQARALREASQSAIFAVIDRRV
jgi:hypothetical protein